MYMFFFIFADIGFPFDPEIFIAISLYLSSHSLIVEEATWLLVEDGRTMVNLRSCFNCTGTD
jgi:hypothetical protein